MGNKKSRPTSARQLHAQVNLTASNPAATYSTPQLPMRRAATSMRRSVRRLEAQRQNTMADVDVIGDVQLMQPSMRGGSLLSLPTHSDSPNLDVGNVPKVPAPSPLPPRSKPDGSSESPRPCLDQGLEQVRQMVLAQASQQLKRNTPMARSMYGRSPVRSPGDVKTDSQRSSMRRSMRRTRSPNAVALTKQATTGNLGSQQEMIPSDATR